MDFPKELNQDTVAQLYRDGVFASKAVISIAEGTTCNDAGLAFLAYLQRHQRLAPLPPSLQARLAEYQALLAVPPPQANATETFLTRVDRGTQQTLHRWVEALTYLGEILWAFCTLFTARFRWADCRLAFRRSGAGAVPVVCLIGFLLGLILAFQSAVPLQLFGAEGFVGGLVGIALVRELGLVITAILMAGRTGSAFAAELGTMQVNEEIDALETMGLHPVRFLALPRVVAGTFALPFLSLFATASGLLGGWMVMSFLGFSMTYYVDQLQTFVALGDFLGSFIKAFIFGFMVSAVGCWFGLKAGRDASAVGTATTAAVVTGIILLTILEGLFAVIFYAMGW